MKAMVLAAGKGTRLREVTKGEIPKPMVDLNGRPLLEYTLDHLTSYGIEEIIINVSYKAEVIKEYFGEEYQGTKIYYSEEEELLGTAGGVKKVEERFNEPFLVIYGDILTDISYENLIEQHKNTDCVGTMMVYQENKENLSEASIVLADEHKTINSFIEKPSEEVIKRHSDKDFWTNAGIYILNSEIFNFINEGFSDFSHDIFPKILESEEKLKIFPKSNQTYWHEVGNPDRYQKALKDLNSDKVDFS